MLFAAAIKLSACGDGRFVRGGGRLTHGLALRLLEREAPELASRIHDGAPLLTSSGLLSPGRTMLRDCSVNRGDRVTVRFTALGEEASTALMCSLQRLLRQRSTVAIGDTVFLPEGIVTKRSQITGRTTFEALWERAVRMDGLPILRFDSPTAFKRCGVWLAMPVPERVFGVSGDDWSGTLLAKWKAAGGPDVLDGFCGSHVGARVLDLRACRVPTPDKGRPLECFTGACLYEVASDSQALRALWALSLFAPYAGVGGKTKWGFGRTRVDSMDGRNRVVDLPTRQR